MLHDIAITKNLGTLLHAASAGNHLKVVGLLLSKGAEANAPGGYWDLPLHGAVGSDNIKVATTLLKAGAQVNAQWKDRTALYIAAQKGVKEMAELLLQNGADVNAETGKWGSALQAATSYGRTEVVKLLLKHGAKVNAQGGECGSALAAASLGCQSIIVSILLQNGADVNAFPDGKKSPLRVVISRHRDDAPDTSVEEIFQLILDRDPNFANLEEWAQIFLMARRKIATGFRFSPSSMSSDDLATMSLNRQDAETRFTTLMAYTKAHAKPDQWQELETAIMANCKFAFELSAEDEEFTSEQDRYVQSSNCQDIEESQHNDCRGNTS